MIVGMIFDLALGALLSIPLYIAWLVVTNWIKGR